MRVGTRQDLTRLVQSPTERLKNANLLFYISLHALDRFPEDYAAKSACICVMGYRLIEGLEVPSSARATFWRVVEELLADIPNIPRGLWMRWHTSLRLAAGYVAFNDGATEKSATYSELSKHT